jgi:hypothetical protein
MRKFKGVLALFLLSFLPLSPCSSEESKAGGLQAVEFLTGYGFMKLKRVETYRFAPVIVDFDFDMRPLVKKWGWDHGGLLQFFLEPFASYAFSAPKNAEVGGHLGLKIGFLPKDYAFQPYLKVGAGLIFFTQHFRRQATQLNFSEFLGLGTHYFLTKQAALTVEYRFRHASNADIARPNGGISTSIWLGGFSYFF